MSGTMSRADLSADLEDSLHDAAKIFKDAGTGTTPFERFLDHAAQDLARVAPRPHVTATLILIADQPNYAAPAGLVRLMSADWGRDQQAQRRPWQPNWPMLPRQSLRENAGAREIWLTPAPTAAQITDLGATYRYTYAAHHSIDAAAANTTVPVHHRGLLLLRAQAEALKELSIRASQKPVLIRDGMSGQARNGTPAALYDQLMTDFLGRAA